MLKRRVSYTLRSTRAALSAGFTGAAPTRRSAGSAYDHALDSGVYLRGVDVSYPAGRRAVTAGDMDEPTVLLLIGSRTAEPTVRPRSPRPRRCSTSIHSTGCGHQREADALYAISQEDYARSFRALMASLRDLGVAAPIPVANHILLRRPGRLRGGAGRGPRGAARRERPDQRHPGRPRHRPHHRSFRWMPHGPPGPDRSCARLARGAHA